MSLTPRAANELRKQLESALREAGLEWIIQQAMERVSLGKTVQRDVDTSLVFHEFGAPTRRSGRRQVSEFLSSEPFDAVEELEILLDAIKAGVISPKKMQSRLFENLEAGISKIRFLPIEGDTSYHFDRDVTKTSVDVGNVRDALRTISKNYQ